LMTMPAASAASYVVNDAFVCLSTCSRNWPTSGLRRCEITSCTGSSVSGSLADILLRKATDLVPLKWSWVPAFGERYHLAGFSDRTEFALRFSTTLLSLGRTRSNMPVFHILVPHILMSHMPVSHMQHTG
jgi:hypothetical protein